MLCARSFLMMAALATALTLSACGDADKKGETLATVNGDKLVSGEVDKQMANLPAQLVQGREADIKRQLLDRLVEQKLIEQEIKRTNVESEQAFKDQLENARKQIAANMVVQKKVNEVLTPAVLQQAYDATKAQRAFPAVKARHILVATEAEANNLITVATPATFEQLAREKSIGPSKDNGGELGWFRREAMVPEFAAVAFSTPVGSIARTPVKTQFGWHVVMVEEKNDKYVPPLEQVAEQIKQELSQQVIQGYLADLRKNAKIDYAEGMAPVAPAAGPAPTAQ
ncbi:MAG: peptidylprolyl isomerase [Alphaproteobacteria bacterium]